MQGSIVECSPFEAVQVPEGWKISLAPRDGDRGIRFLRVELVADHPRDVSPLIIKWAIPCVDISASWYPEAGWRRGKPPEWAKEFLSKATSQAPVVCLHNERGMNRYTMAVSDAINAIRIRHGIHEESGNYWFTLTFFSEPLPKMMVYRADIRLDTRNIPYHEALSSVSEWWADMPGYEPSVVPEAARQPMYSTWYGFHQNLDAHEVEEECRIAKSLGCEAVIVDDGWQTLDDKRGYAYCGDWTPDRIPDMAGHVANIHGLGLKYILWYAVPFVGKYSEAYGKFKDKLLDFMEGWCHAGVLDPRFPEVREYLIGKYERAMLEWDPDGFKLDFVDSFNATPETAALTGGGRDYASVPEAVDRLLTDIITRLRRIKPDVMVEFRQSYIGPLMRKYGNMFRAGDCPNDQNQNRVSTVDIRLIAGKTPAHSDMVMWHPEETPENVAMQFIHAFFAVPQVSVILNRLPEAHFEVVRFWLATWKEYRDLILDGRLEPMHPEALYPVVMAGDGRRKLAAVYTDAVLNPGNGDLSELVVINGTMGDRVVLELDLDMGNRTIAVKDCRGRIVHDGGMHLGAGLHSLRIPPAGIVVIR